MLAINRRPRTDAGQWSRLDPRLPYRSAPAAPDLANGGATVWAREFQYANGRWNERPATVAPAPRRKGRKGQLYVLADAEGRWSSEIADEVRDAVADYFYGDASGSLTSALVRAIQTVNQELFEENERSIRAERHYATVCCVVLRGDDVYFALAGRGLSYLIRSDAGERFGRGDLRPGERPVSLIGQSEEVDVELHHRTLQQPGAIILASSGLLDLIGNDSREALRGRPDQIVDGIRAVGREHRGKRPFRALVIVPGGLATEETDLPAQHADSSTNGVQMVPRRSSTDDIPVEIATWLEGRPRSGSRVGPRGPADVGRPDAPVNSPRPSRSAQLEHPSPRWPRRVAAPGEPLLDDRKPTAPVGRLATDSRGAAVEPLRSVSRGNTSPEPTLSPGATKPAPASSHASPASTLEDDELDSLPAEADHSWLAGLLAFPEDPRRILLALILVLALFAIGYVGVLIGARILQGGAPYTAAMSNLTRAQQREGEAMGQSDPLVRRHLLQEADQLARQALTAQPDNPLAITVAARIQREYRAASGIVDLPEPTPVVGLPAPADQIIVNDTDLYVLDRTNSRLYRYLLGADGAMALSGSNPVLVQQGDRIGAATVDHLSSMAWLPSRDATPTGSLAVLDAAGFLIQYDPVHGLSTVSLRDPGSWAGVKAIGGSLDHLLALNPTQQTLASFPSQDGSFDGPVYSYFAPDVSVNLSNAVDLAIQGNDLYLLHANGQLQRFRDGKPIDFSNPPSDVLPAHPTGLALGDNSLFLADAEHSRIIQLSRSGTYQRQLTDREDSTILSQARSIALGADQSVLYVLADAKIYRYSLSELRQ